MDPNTSHDLKSILAKHYTDRAKDHRVFIYTLLVVIILIAIMFTWWLDWVPADFWYIKLLMTIALILLLYWLYSSYQ